MLGELRQRVLSALLGNPLFSEAEQLRANHFAHECEDVTRLTRWHANVLAEVARRAADVAHQRSQDALRATLRHLRPASFRGYRPRQPQPAPAWVPGAPLPDRADRYAGTFDRRAAARFQPAGSLTLTHLLATPAR
ncbi:hypothetical protein A0257_22680 (plasmid) [Hymenobacter psoromatis]|nr:hypothetical protein A0257_22680 [Hymenobacter psoromatis]